MQRIALDSEWTWIVIEECWREGGEVKDEWLKDSREGEGEGGGGGESGRGGGLAIESVLLEGPHLNWKSFPFGQIDRQTDGQDNDGHTAIRRRGFILFIFFSLFFFFFFSSFFFFFSFFHFFFYFLWKETILTWQQGLPSTSHVLSLHFNYSVWTFKHREEKEGKKRDNRERKTHTLDFICVYSAFLCVKKTLERSERIWRYRRSDSTTRSFTVRSICFYGENLGRMLRESWEMLNTAGGVKSK